ncbi:energy transducer TonB [Kiritimatiellota bacterium B12222]|nr:energy transducer TonB [Kiritimatiellota bacterium B12222]
MKTTSKDPFSQTAPRWTFRVVLLSMGMTGLLFTLLPLTERLSRRPEPDMTLRKIETIRVPPPLTPPAPPPESPVDRAVTEVLPQPVLQQAAAPVKNLRLPVDLHASTSSLQGVYQTGFQVEGDALAAGMQLGVFEIADLDQAPRALVRVNPVYPPQARMRKIEGYVTIEFVVEADGRIEDVVVIDSKPGDIFVRSVERAIRGWRFEAGKYQGNAVASRVRQRIDFNLD